MAITRQDFAPVPSDGIIPEGRAPAAQFAVGYSFIYTGYPSIGSFNQSFTGTIRLHVVRSDDSVKYAIEIKQTYNLFIFPLAPGLLMYTWNWVPSAESIVGRKGDDPTDPDAPLMTTLGQGSFGVDPAEGQGTGNSEAIVASTFYSGIFTEPLARGDKLKIVFHNLSAGFVVSRASMLLATSGTIRRLDVKLGHFGEIVTASGLDTAIQGGHTFAPHNLANGRGYIRNASDPSILIMPDGREIIGVLQPGGFFEYESHNTQRSWTRVRYGDEEASLLPEGVSVPQLIQLQNARLAIGIDGSKVIVRRVTPEGVGDLITLGDAGDSELYSMDVDGSGAVWVYNDAGQAAFHSDNDGLSFKPVVQTQTA